MQSVCSHPTPSCYPINRATCCSLDIEAEISDRESSRTVQQISDSDPHVMKQAVWEARGNGESERSVN